MTSFEAPSLWIAGIKFRLVLDGRVLLKFQDFYYLISLVTDTVVFWIICQWSKLAAFDDSGGHNIMLLLVSEFMFKSVLIVGLKFNYEQREAK